MSANCRPFCFPDLERSSIKTNQQYPFEKKDIWVLWRKKPVLANIKLGNLFKGRNPWVTFRTKQCHLRKGPHLKNLGQYPPFSMNSG